MSGIEFINKRIGEIYSTTAKETCVKVNDFNREIGNLSRRIEELEKVHPATAQENKSADQSEKNKFNVSESKLYESIYKVLGKTYPSKVIGSVVVVCENYNEKKKNGKVKKEGKIKVLEELRQKFSSRVGTDIYGRIAPLLK